MEQDDRQPTLVDLFAGCGGVRLAFQQAGYKCLWGCEIDEAAQDTYQANFGDRPHGDVFKLPLHELPVADVVAGGIPCQPYSKAGHMKGFDDPRADTFDGMMGVVAAHRPKVVLIENVPGLLQQSKGAAFRRMKDGLRSMGYSHVSHAVLDATEFGGAQHRERLFIVAAAKSFSFSTLERSHVTRMVDILQPAEEVEWMDPSEYTLIENPKVQRSGLVFAGYRNKGMRSPDKDPRSSGNHYQQNRIYSSHGVFQTISSQETSGRQWVAVGNSGARRLTRLELQRLQGFPDDFVFPKGGPFYKQVGNSVHVPCVRAIAEGIKRQLL